MAAGTKTLLECGDLCRAAGHTRGPASSENIGSSRSLCRQLHLSTFSRLGSAEESVSTVQDLKVNFFSVVSARLTSGASGTRRVPSARLGSRFLRCCQIGRRGDAPSASRPHSVNVGSAIQRAPCRSSVTSGHVL